MGSDDSETTAEEPEDDPLEDGLANDPLTLALDSWPHLSKAQDTFKGQTASGASGADAAAAAPTRRSRTRSQTSPFLT